jgi:hypothetical protein
MDENNNQKGIDTRKETYYSNNSFDITRIVTAYINSGSLNGSLPNKIRPDVYNYTNYNATKGENAKHRKEFNMVFKSYLYETKVNNLISLKAYLQFIKDNNTAEIDKIHNRRPTRPTGNAINNRPILLFAENGSLPIFSIPLSNVDLIGVGFSKMQQFLKENGETFSSEIPDEFFQNYYLKTQFNTEKPKIIKLEIVK